MADNLKMIKNLFAGMQNALFLGDRFSQGEFVSFLQPGQFVSQNLQENDSSFDMAIQSQLANIIIDSSYVNKYKDINYSTGTELIGSVDQVYSDIMRHSALPHKDLSEGEMNEINNLNEWFKKNQSNYDQYATEYDQAVMAYTVEQKSQHPDPGKLSILDRKIKQAEFNWNTFGQKKLYNLKKGRFLHLSQESPEAFWAILNEKMDAQEKMSPDRSRYLQTFLIPSISQWNSGGWSNFEDQISESKEYNYSKATSWSGGASIGFGLWSIGGGAGGSSVYSHNESQASTVDLKFEYLRVRIFRPWMTDDVFGYRFWTCNKQFGGFMVSDGGNLAQDPPLRPIGRMPILPQYLIIVRNLELKATFTESESDFYNKQIQGGASVGWGPFSLSGSYREDTTTKYAKASFDGVTFKIQNPQIIARTGIMLPQSPNPIKALSWDTDEACFPGQECFTNKPDIVSVRADDMRINLRFEKLMEAENEVNKMKEKWLGEKIVTFK